MTFPNVTRLGENRLCYYAYSGLLWERFRMCRQHGLSPRDPKMQSNGMWSNSVDVWKLLSSGMRRSLEADLLDPSLASLIGGEPKSWQSAEEFWADPQLLRQIRQVVEFHADSSRLPPDDANAYFKKVKAAINVCVDGIVHSTDDSGAVKAATRMIFDALQSEGNVYARNFFGEVVEREMGERGLDAHQLLRKSRVEMCQWSHLQTFLSVKGTELDKLLANLARALFPAGKRARDPNACTRILGAGRHATTFANSFSENPACIADGLISCCMVMGWDNLLESVEPKISPPIEHRPVAKCAAVVSKKTRQIEPKTAPEVKAVSAEEVLVSVRSTAAANPITRKIVAHFLPADVTPEEIAGALLKLGKLVRKLLNEKTPDGSFKTRNFVGIELLRAFRKREWPAEEFGRQMGLEPEVTEEVLKGRKLEPEALEALVPAKLFGIWSELKEKPDKLKIALAATELAHEYQNATAEFWQAVELLSCAVAPIGA